MQTKIHQFSNMEASFTLNIGNDMHQQICKGSGSVYVDF